MVEKIKQFLINNKKKIIVLEGLDVAGKETLANKLKAKTNGVIIDFPRYQTELGQQIKEKLYSGDKTGIAELFELDRNNFWNKDLVTIKETTIIFDRLHHCNLAYNNLTESAEESFFQELRKGNLIDCRVVFLLKTTPVAFKNHELYINKKQNKDKNETLEFQNKINQNYLTLFENKTIELKAQDLILEIGTDFEIMVSKILNE